MGYIESILVITLLIKQQFKIIRNKQDYKSRDLFKNSGISNFE